MKNLRMFAVLAVVVSVFALSGCGEVVTESEEVVDDVVVEEVEVPVLEMMGFSFELPSNWIVLNVEETSDGGYEVELQVPDPKYNVTIPMSFWKSAYPVEDVNKFLVETSSGISIYSHLYVPAISGYKLVDGEDVYDVSFAMPKSEQPIPENLDGPWFPDTIITAEDTLDFVSTVKKI